MSTRLDAVLQKHPDYEEGIRLLAERDPSGSLKYLAWGGAMLASGQALAPEVADVLELFHRIVQTKKAIKKRIEKDRKKVAKRAAKKAKQKR